MGANKEALNKRTEARAKLSLGVAIAALVVSFFSFVWPISSSIIAHNSIEWRYLKSLVELTSQGPKSAKAQASQGSQADLFATTIANAWRASEENGAVNTTEGDVRGGWGTFEVCFPHVDFIPKRCSTFADFEYSETNKITRFTIDGLTVEQLFTSEDYENLATTSDPQDSEAIDAKIAGKIRTSDESKKTIVLWFYQHKANSKVDEILTFSRVRAEDRDSELIEIESSSFPEAITYTGTYFASVTGPASIGYLYVCYEGEKSGEVCSWIYRL